MKWYLNILVFSLISYTCSAQEAIYYEASPKPISFSEIDYEGGYYQFVIEERYGGEFEEDPIKFLNTYFDAASFLDAVSHKNYSGLELNFQSSNGALKATVNKNGRIVRTYHSCKNVLVPRNIQKEIYQNYKGWTMVKNTHIAKGRKEKIDREFFKVKLLKDGKVKRIKLPLDKSNNNGIAGHQNK